MMARVFSSYDEEGARFAAFGSDAVGTEHVIFSIVLEPDQQDRDLGLDGIHIEISGQGNGGYDKVARIVSTPSGLTVHPKDPDDPLRIDIANAAEAAGTVAALKSICDFADVAFEEHA
jgi:hypothetical protein